MKSKIILFDIDRTIFDNEKFIELKDKVISKTLKIANIEEYKKIFKDYYGRLKNTRNFKPRKFINLVCKKYKYSDQEYLFSITYLNKDIYSKCLYNDVLQSIKELHSKTKIGIFSEGIINFQNFKIQSLGIEKYLDKDLIFIVPAKDTKEVINKLPKGVVIVDDKESICNFLFENGIECIWINRKDDRKSDKYKTIHSLLELPDILEEVR